MKKEDRRAEREYRRHVRIWKFLKVLVKGIFCRLLNYSFTKAPKDLKAPYIVVSNHNTDFDPILVGIAFSQHMYIVASEHVFRFKFFSKLIVWAFNPIAKMKGASDTLTVMKMIRYLRSGKNVLIFPEGNRSYNGETCHINEAIGKLIKTSGASLVTFKFQGGYLSTPRWGYGIRKGKMNGGIVNIYSAEQLKEMEPACITQTICTDLYENAFQTQNSPTSTLNSPVLYKGKNRAVGFESAFCVCPECREVGTIASSGNEIFCKKCGKKSEYKENGTLEGDFTLHTPYEWDCFQEEFYKTFVTNTQNLLFKDTDVVMKNVNSEHKTNVLGTGTLELYKDRLCLNYDSQNKEILISNIPDMSIYGRCGLVFTDTEGTHYEVTPARKKDYYNARKYLSCWQILRNVGGK